MKPIRATQESANRYGFQNGLLVAVCFLAIILLIQSASALVNTNPIPASKDPNHADRPEIINSLKSHVAYVCELQDARMSGTIRYIGNISNANGTRTLDQIRDDYLATASSIPLLKTNDEIVKARDSLHTYTAKFSDEVKTQMVLYNGNSSTLLLYTRAAVNGADAAILRSNGTLWLADASARLDVFNRDSMKRMLEIGGLRNRSIEVTKIQNLSEQIDAQRPALVQALTSRSVVNLKAANEKIRMLTKEYRDAVAAARSAWEIRAKRDAMMAMG